MDDLATFSARLPTWTAGGVPLSYRHFRYGMAWINRDAIRHTMSAAAAARAGGATKDSYADWRRDMSEAL